MPTKKRARKVAISSEEEESSSLPSSGEEEFSSASSSNSDNNDYDEEDIDFGMDDPDIDEPSEDYKVGGYALIEPGMLLGSVNKQWKIDSKLGWGSFSTVWLAYRAQASTGNRRSSSSSGAQVPVALKVVKSKKHYTEMADDEINVFKKIARVSPSGHPYLIRMLDSFTHKDQFGLHRCLVFECQGTNLYRLLKDAYPQGFPLNTVKRFANQMYQAIEFLHVRCNLLHTDLKPENLLMSAGADINRPETFSLVLSDLGNVDEPKHSRESYSVAQTRQYRAPEVILRHGYSYPVDIWSAACIVFELATGELLFDPERDDEENLYKKNDDHLAKIISYIGPAKLSFLTKNTNTLKRFFNKKYQLKCGRSDYQNSIEKTLVHDMNWDSKEASALSTFLLKQLRWEPTQRLRATDVLRDPWLTIRF